MGEARVSSIEDMDREMAEAYASLFRRWLANDDPLVRIIPLRAPAVTRAGVPASRIAPLVEEAETRVLASGV